MLGFRTASQLSSLRRCCGGRRIITWRRQLRPEEAQGFAGRSERFGFAGMDLSLHGAIQIYGGDSSGIQDLLKQVEATQQAFAAILSDGSAITWGVASYGGDSSQVQHKLRGVKQVRGTDYAFAAILADGFVHEAIHKLVVTALEPNFWPRNVQQLQATKGAFAAVLA